MFSECSYNEADLARSLLFSISNDIGQIACLYAMMHNLKKVKNIIILCLTCLQLVKCLLGILWRLLLKKSLT